MYSNEYLCGYFKSIVITATYTKPIMEKIVLHNCTCRDMGKRKHKTIPNWGQEV